MIKGVGTDYAYLLVYYDILICLMSWEDTFRSWAQGPSQTEQEKCANAERVICDALNNDTRLSKLNITVFTQGSYKARTNVRLDSDVDICVRLNNTFFPDYPEGKTNEDYGNIASKISFSDYKDLVHAALESRFGRSSVARGNKAFNVHANTYRIDADVVPAFDHRRYTGPGRNDYLKGVAFECDDGTVIKNWPEQTHDNGVTKNSATGRRYKRVIRILKRLRNDMQEDRVSAAGDVASFLIESLVWNTPNDGFNHSDYKADVRFVLAHTFNETVSEQQCSKWGEVNELKYLFKGPQPWTREQAHNFLSAAWSYIGFD